MEALIFLHAVVVAIFDVLALTDGSKNVFARAPFAGSYDQGLTLFELEGEGVFRALAELDNYLLGVAERQLADSESCVH